MRRLPRFRRVVLTQMLRSKTCLLEPKRANNIVISFRRLHVDSIGLAAAMQSCDMNFLTDDVVDILAKIVPSDEVRLGCILVV